MKLKAPLAHLLLSGGLGVSLFLIGIPNLRKNPWKSQMSRKCLITGLT